MKPYQLHRGNNIELLRGMADNSVDSIVTDPPYELGFMGKAWDSKGIASNVELWRECLRVLKPGGYLLAFGGTRTYHRMACAIEDAGFEIRDQIGWAYGSGMPKGTDKAKIPEPWRGDWNTALKPAWEPIVVARKEMVGTLAENLLAHGTGALNIDGCRVGDSKDVPASVSRSGAGASLSGSVDGSLRKETGMESGHNPNVGRWPANLIHDGSDEVLAAFPQASGAVAPVRGTEPSGKTDNTFGEFAGRAPSDQRDGGGSAARFFYCAKASRADRNDGLQSGSKPAVGTGATMREREDADWASRNGNFHPTVKPTELMRYLVRLVTPAGGTVLDVFNGSGSTGKAAVLEGLRYIGLELDEDADGNPIGYIAISEARLEAAWRSMQVAPPKPKRQPKPAPPPVPGDKGYIPDLFA